MRISVCGLYHDISQECEIQPCGGEFLELLDFGVEGDSGVGEELDGAAVGKIFGEDGGIGPFEVPAVFEGEQRVTAGEDGSHVEGAIGIALVAVKLGRVLARIVGDEKDHGAGEGFSVLEGKTTYGACGFGDMDGQFDGLSRGNFDGAARKRGASGFGGTDLKERLVVEVDFVRSGRKSRSGEGEFSFIGNAGLVGFASLGRAELKQERRGFVADGRLIGSNVGPQDDSGNVGERSARIEVEFRAGGKLQRLRTDGFAVTLKRSEDEGAVT